MDMNWIMPIVIIGFGAFAGAMYIYRKMTAGETFSWAKFLPTMGYGAIAALVLWVGAGTIPDLNAIITQIELLAPGGAPSVSAIIAALLVIWNGLSKVNQPTATAMGVCTTTPKPVPVPVPETVPVVTPAVPVSDSTGPGWISSGFKVTPAFNVGYSPYLATLQAVVGMSSDMVHRCRLVVDWMDGTPRENIPVEPTQGIASMTHQYVYVKGDSKYSGHSFYPMFFVIDDATGVTQTYNLTNKCCEIEVQST